MRWDSQDGVEVDSQDELQSFREKMGIRANGEFDPNKLADSFASKWEFEQMGIFLRKSSRNIGNENISCQMRQFSAPKDSKSWKMRIQNLASLFASKWEFEQMGIFLVQNERKLRKWDPICSRKDCKYVFSRK